MVYLQLDRIVLQDQGAELREIVLEVILLRVLGVILEQRVAPADRDVTDSQV